MRVFKVIDEYGKSILSYHRTWEGAREHIARHGLMNTCSIDSDIIDVMADPPVTKEPKQLSGFEKYRDKLLSQFRDFDLGDDDE